MVAVSKLGFQNAYPKSRLADRSFKLVFKKLLAQEPIFENTKMMTLDSHKTVFYQDNTIWIRIVV